MVPAQLLAENMELGLSLDQTGRKHVTREPSHLVTGTLRLADVVLVVPPTEPP